MTLTDEQQKIVQTASKMYNNQILKIQAFAGTGKTSTLVQIANFLKDKKFLYLAFNKSIVKESKSKFGSNVTILTTHSLAFRYVLNGKDVELRKDYKAVEIMNLFNVNMDTAIKALKTFNEFCNSKDKEIKGTAKVKAVANKLYLSMKNSKLPITHSFYLKEFGLNFENYKKDMNYDYILLDEAQDTNEITLDIFLKFDSKKIMVGDTHQAIYSFRGAINAMKLKSDYTLSLTTTFRCDNLIVDYANKVLEIFKNEKTKMKAFSKKGNINSFAVICRTNASIINIIAKALDHNKTYPNKPIYYKLLREPKAIFETSINLHLFLEKKFDKIESNYRYLLGFKGINSLIEYIEDCKDIELSSSLNIAKKYKGFLYVLLSFAKEWYKIESNDYLTTAHTSKGLEFDEVRLLKDFPSLKDLREEVLIDHTKMAKFYEEVNLYYVAITRAKFILRDDTENKIFMDRFS